MQVRALKLRPERQALVERIRRLEREFECKVDTSGTRIEVEDYDARMLLGDLPVADFGESGCLGWKGPERRLRHMRSPDGYVHGVIRPGDDLIFAFSDEGDWSFARIMRGGVPAGHGWAILDINNSVCENLAG